MVGFDVDAKQLADIVRLTFDKTTADDVEKEVVPVLKERYGGEIDGLLKKLKVEKEVGVRESEVPERREFFGINRVEQEPQESLLHLMWEALQDPTLIFLTCAAMFSLFIAVFVEQKAYGWLEGVAILFAVLVVVTVGAVNDYQKESQFRELNAKADDVPITVVRDGITKKISTFDLVIGDIVMLSTGDILPADGIIIGRNDLEINEKMLTGETELKKKSSKYVITNSTVRSAPTCFAGTFVQAGEGQLLVMAVGAKTYQGQMEEKMKEAEAGRSILQTKLDAMTELITLVGMYISVALVIILCLRMIYGFYTQKCCMEAWDHKVHWSEVLGFVITGITIFVVAVPEGLPLAVTIALAFSVKKMLKDQNLVRHLSACETMGGATTICSDKTGTLTTSRMTVVKMWCGDRQFSDIKQVSGNLPKMRKQISTAAVVNTLSKSYLKLDSKGTPQYCGNDTECALLFMSNQIGEPYESVREIYRNDDPSRKCYSFSSDRKRMSTVVRSDGGLKVFTKGAAEIVSALCVQYYTDTGDVKPLDQTMRAKIDKAIEDFADEGLRTICIASRVLPTGFDLESADLSIIEKDLTIVCIVGIEDPLRDEVPGAIADCKTAGIVVRMVTGDNVRTARAIAKKCGIISDESDVVMEGKEFREKVCDENGEIIQFEFDKVWPKLRVLARSTPLDKHVLVSGIQASQIGPTKQTVAVTGDGTNDAPALKKADVGFAMGIQGTEVAKNAADVIIMDDNFVSIVAAVKWGRCVYDNICKFLQFQLTVNLTACMLACVGAAILTESPLSAIQLLWVNLIMDSFASLALATEDPNDSLLKRMPYPRDQAVLSPTMIRNMVCHSVWQLLILSVLIFMVGDVCEGHGDACTGKKLVDHFGDLRSGRPASYDMNNIEGLCPAPAVRPKDFCAQTHGNDPTKHYTIIFNTFVLLQVFNEINARKIHGEVNVFEGMFKHPLFLIIVIGTLIVQVALIELPGLNTAFGCTSLSQAEWALCLVLGASSIPVIFGWISPSLFASGDSRAGTEALAPSELAKLRRRRTDSLVRLEAIASAAAVPILANIGKSKSSAEIITPKVVPPEASLRQRAPSHPQ